VGLAGWAFNDIRPRDYRQEVNLDVHVGHLLSPSSIAKMPFYLLNYCESTGQHRFTDGSADASDDHLMGSNMFDDEIHESFFQVSSLRDPSLPPI